MLTHWVFFLLVLAFVETTQYLLNQGVPYVLSQDMCQDPLEEHFGRHRGVGSRHDNPTVYQFGYVFTCTLNKYEDIFCIQKIIACFKTICSFLFKSHQENHLRLQRNLAFMFNPRGNTAGRQGERRPPQVSNSPMKKRKH